MFNWKKVSLILLASAALLSGCTQSNIVSPADGKIQGDGQPDTEIDKDIKIDWEEVRSDLEEQYLEPVSYTHLDVYKRQRSDSRLQKKFNSGICLFRRKMGNPS